MRGEWVTGKVPLLLLVMGVSGSGKTTLASALGAALGLHMIDGDDLHSAENVAKMQSGIALDDADRWPWLDRIADYLGSNALPGGFEQGKVVACSALKRAYRDRIRHAQPGVRFIFLDGASELIRGRMALRQGHFMQLDMLESQLRTLERPAADEVDVVTLNTSESVDSLVAQVYKRYQQS